MSEAVRASVKTPEIKKGNKVSQVQKGNSCRQVSSPVEQILFLQRTIGNQTVQRLIKSGALQAKLRIGAPGDIYEQEADRVADAVVRIPETKAVSGKTSNNPVQSACSKCSGCSLPKAEEAFQLKEVQGLKPENTQGLGARINVARTGSQPLSGSARAFFEPRFGQDFSSVRVHNSAEADTLNRRLNARAFTVGHDIFFREGEFNPYNANGKELLAHELTHVVQQVDNGVKRKPSFSRSGDLCENETDSISRALVNLEAKDNKPHIVMQYSNAEAVHRKPEKMETDANAAYNAVYAMVEVLQHDRLIKIEDVDPKYQESIRDLHSAVIGYEQGKKISASRSLELFEDALVHLRPNLLAFEQDKNQKTYLDVEVTPYVNRYREFLNLQKARERVAKALIGAENKIVEIPEGGDPHAEAIVLHGQIPSLIETLAMLNEQAIRLGHGPIHHAASELFHGEIPHQVKGKWGDPGLLVEMQGVLSTIDGLLTLTDPELSRKLAESHGFWNGAANVIEFVKAVTQIVGGFTQMALSFSSALAKFSGAAESAAQAAGAARLLGLTLANIVAGIEIAHGVAVLADKHASTEEKEEGAKDVAVGTAWFAGEYGVPLLFKGASRVGGPLSIAVLVTYYEMKFMANLYGQARVGIMGMWMSNAYETMGDAAKQITYRTKELANAGMLLELEKRPEQITALGKVQKEKVESLSGYIDFFLEQCEPIGYGMGAAYKPGAYTVFRREFAPLLKLKGSKTPQAASAAAIAVLEKLNWVFEHKNELLLESSGYPEKIKELKKEGAH